MKVKIGDKIYTSNEQPIMVILTQSDKENISNMLPEAFRYAEFSGSLQWNKERKLTWMDEIAEDGKQTSS